MTEQFTEVSSDEPQVEDKVELSARVIHEAYQAYKEALLSQLGAQLERVNWEQGDEYGTPVDNVLVTTEYRVKLAQAEVDRVTALMNFFQIESILKASNVI